MRCSRGGWPPDRLRLLTDWRYARNYRVSYPSNIELHNNGAPRQSVAFAYSTKDRTELSARTLAPLRAEEGFDLYWMDGSRTDEGRALPGMMGPELPALREVHYGITGGPDVAIVYSLTYLLAKDYAYVGLIENDVLLEPGWLQRLIRLFAQGAQDGLRVGAVSARTIRERTLIPREDYAVMFNLGAGMILLTREAARAVLERYRTTTGEEIRGIVRARTGIDLAGIGYAQTSSSADWFFDAGLLLDGYCSLAPIPSLANNIDADLSKWGATLVRRSSDVPVRPCAFELFRAMHRMAFEAVPKQTAYHPSLGRVVFPHQLVAAMPDCVSQGWVAVWRQTFGPFAIEAKSPGVTIELPAFGSPVAFIMEAGPESGEIAVRFGNEETRFSLMRDKSETLLIRCSGQSATAVPTQLSVLRPPVVCCGVQLLESWFSFSSAPSFDFEVLRPFVGS